MYLNFHCLYVVRMEQGVSRLHPFQFLSGIVGLGLMKPWYLRSKRPFMQWDLQLRTNNATVSWVKKTFDTVPTLRRPRSVLRDETLGLA